MYVSLKWIFISNNGSVFQSVSEDITWQRKYHPLRASGKWIWNNLSGDVWSLPKRHTKFTNLYFFPRISATFSKVTHTMGVRHVMYFIRNAFCLESACLKCVPISLLLCFSLKEYFYQISNQVILLVSPTD